MKALQHPVAWAAPQPFWRSNAQPTPVTRASQAQPQILRFVSDEFIEELLATLERKPHALPDYTAQAETWREPHAGPLPNPSLWLKAEPRRLLPLQRKAQARGTPTAPPQPKPLKLYQAAHQRHYLVAGSLVCQAPGLPDRAVDPARQRVSFLIRRLFPKVVQAKGDPLPNIEQPALWDEHAWVLAGSSAEWRAVAAAAPEQPLDDEERLAMFPARFAEVAGQPRRLFVGSVPVGRREAYQAGEKRSLPRSASELTTLAYQSQFRNDVLVPWRTQVGQAREVDGLAALKIFKKAAFSTETSQITVGRDPVLASDVDDALLRQLRDQLQLDAWYLLRDLRRFLQRYLPDYLAWLLNPVGAMPDGLAAFDSALRRVVTPAGLSSGGLAYTTGQYSAGKVAAGLPDAIARMTDTFADRLDNAMAGLPGYAAVPFDSAKDGAVAATVWPDFLFLFYDPVFDVPTPRPDAVANDSADYPTEQIQARIDKLVEDLPVTRMASDKPPPEPSLASRAPTDMREAWYVMRLVYERPDCQPFEGPVISRPTAPFQLAGFFDPDAPARPIRIGLPIDISPAGLRKFDKNAIFMMSDMLCGQVDRFKGMTFGDLVLSVLPWPFHKSLSVPDKGPCKQDGLSLGVMCSLSIPIITICALILLMIIVALLDFIFRWLPLFIVCFPLPGFKGKK